VPILVRPVREQIEHDRVIRQLQDKWRKKYRADINPGDERTAVVQAGTAQFYPDLVLTTEGQKKPSAVVEVETGESVNHLEAMSQWATFAKSRIPFYLFVPAASLDTARRLVTDHSIELTELWTYFVIGEQIRFTPVIRSAASAGDVVVERSVPEKRTAKRDKAATAGPATAVVEGVTADEAEVAVEPAAPVVAKAAPQKASASKASADKAGPEKTGAEKAGAEKAAAEKGAEKVGAAGKSGDKAGGEKAAASGAGKSGDKAAAKQVPEKAEKAEKVAAAAVKAPAQPTRPQRSERAAAPAPTARRAASGGRGAAPPPRRKTAVVAKRAATPKRGPARPAAKRAVAAKHPARAAAKAAVRRPAKTSRPAAKRARAQKRK